MQKVFFINQKVIIINFTCRTDSHIHYYVKQVGNIKGVKKLQNHITIYLIEFLNHNRIWIIPEEFKKY